ncbi:MAG: serine hydrolase domain-containing protein [Limosilactobacillus sp.]|uniref:serine hydrolase domain-containing protein n=1 Tax=Limosilactobacillus sp. TaxID=2773925 RepID=UPI002710D67F|nr:serine hydrolase domain-containing protein [Limosilactobacillus sp.]
MKKYSHTIAQLESMVDTGTVPGISYLIFEGGEEIRQVRGLSQTRPFPEHLEPGMKYDLASLTKVIGTVPVIAMLKQEGKLDLDDPVKQFLPEFSDDRPTVRNLLTHTSGIAGYIPHRDELPADQLKQAFLTQMSVNSAFNRQIRYADVNYLYLGWIIEAICDKPVQEVITERVLWPLGMDGATFAPDPADCVPTEVQSKRGLIRGTVHDPKAYILGEHCGCAGMFATLDDLAKYCHTLIEDRLGGLLTKETIDEFFSDQTPIPGEHSRSLGWKLLHSRGDAPHYLISHTGFTGTWLILDRERDAGMVVLTNRVHPTAKNQKYLDMRDEIFATYLNELEN